ncbi:hypothetical protein EST38_g9868 [Candolleomyces aberdarensis]|uniref:G domain-containing protein n=1 Tax=Candolleomyces aberdarensis TaxID=2316362 RepID=A0A4Q2D9J3_9AGAR|nr:hypothetical protein EST38_g9868 [Candolleomyces aberdarensis]
MDNTKKTVAVVGDTGVGKSSFINAFFGKQVAQVSSETCSCTKSVEEFHYKRRDGLVVSLVDTPGFNSYDQDSQDVKTDVQILQMISTFLDAQQDKVKSFSGIVFLHSINSGSLPQTSKKFTRTFKRLCGDDQLRNVVVVTTRWDEFCYDGEAFQDLSNAGVQFLRTGHFDDQAPQPPGDQYQSPLTIVEQLLGLDPDEVDDQWHTVEEKAIQDDASPLVLEDNLGASLTQRSPWEIRQTSFIANQLESFEARQGQELKSAHSEILEAQGKLSSHIVRSLDDISAELKQALEVNLKELAVERQMFRERERDLNDALNKLHDEKDRIRKELHATQVALAEQRIQVEVVRMESGSIYASGLRAQLEEMKGDCENVKTSQLETERELERTNKAFEEAKKKLQTQALELDGLRDRVQAQTIESELRTKQIMSLELELEEEKKKSEEQTQQLIRLRKQAQDKTNESEHRTRQNASLEKVLMESKKKLEEQAQESTRLRKQAQDKTANSRSFTNRVPYQREAELEEWKQRSEEQEQESDYSQNQAQGESSKKIASPEQEPRSFRTDLPRPSIPARRPRTPSPSAPTQPDSPSPNPPRTSTPLIQRQSASPVNQPLGFSASTRPQPAPSSTQPHLPRYNPFQFIKPSAR